MTAGPGGTAPISTLADYHTHTSRCGHAQGEPRDYVEAALAAGLSQVGISDHLPVLNASDAELAMGLDELDAYVDEVLDLKRLYPGYVLLGVEADYHPRTIDRVEEILAAHPFDYVIGSVHFIGEWGFDDPRQAEGFDTRRVDEVYEAYYSAVREAVATGAFTIIGHLDLVKKWGHRSSPGVDATLQALIDDIARAGAIVEVNTAGLHKPVAELYPSTEVLTLLRRAGVAITFGSDAHLPAHVGRDFAQAVQAARAAGYTEFARLEAVGFDMRARSLSVPLPG